MKPPARANRSTKSALQVLKKKPALKTKSDPSTPEKWQFKELRNILGGLRYQYRARLDDIDTCALQTRVPKRSLQEVESLLESLKLTVARKVFGQVRKQMNTEPEQRVPIQVWTEWMERIAGNHEENISSAFTRMLVIAGTEPCSLQHSDPPRQLDSASSAITSAEIAKLATTGNSLGSGAQICSSGDGQLAGMQGVVNPNVSCTDKGNSLPSKSSFGQSISTEAVVSGVSATFTSGITSCFAAQHTQTPAQSVSTGHSSAPVGASSSLTLQSQKSVEDQGGKSTQGNQSQCDRPENTVDFEKLYSFLGTISKGGSASLLTPMECAVILDLIMSLPEELPLLDCESLQEHFVQVYSRLATPCNTSLTGQGAEPTNLSEETSSGVETDESTAVPQAPKVRESWESIGICPLNPLMVPISLLARKGGQSS